jgi:DNA-binding MltR family transcriptional regulator
MPNSYGSVSKLNEMSRSESGLLEAFHFVKTIDQREDRALAILLATQLEETLQDYLLFKMVPLNKTELRGLFNHSAPLATFSGKNEIAYAFRLIGPATYKDIDAVRAIRNAFAHTWKDMTFQTPEVAAVCASLKTPSFVSAEVAQDEPWPPAEPRRRFRATVQLIQGEMMTRVLTREDSVARELSGLSAVKLDLA